MCEGSFTLCNSDWSRATSSKILAIYLTQAAAAACMKTRDKPPERRDAAARDCQHHSLHAEPQVSLHIGNAGPYLYLYHPNDPLHQNQTTTIIIIIRAST